MSSLSPSPERDPCITQVRVLLGLILTPAAWKFYLLFFWPTSLVTHDIREREMKQTRKKNPEWQVYVSGRPGNCCCFAHPSRREKEKPQRKRNTPVEIPSRFFFFFLLSGILVTRFGYFSAHLRHYLSIRTGFGFGKTNKRQIFEGFKWSNQKKNAVIIIVLYSKLPLPRELRSSY